MPHRLHRIQDGTLYAPDGTPAVTLDSPAWFAWLADDQHHSFHVSHLAGDFTARKERKQRGQWYWVAYRQMNKKLYKVYLGKSECLTTARLIAAAESLAEAMSSPAPSGGDCEDAHAARGP